MSVLRVTIWTLIGVLIAAMAFLAATIRVVEPGRAVAGNATRQDGARAPLVERALATTPRPQADPGPALTMPVVGADITRLRSNWGDARGGGTRVHQGFDIMAPGGTQVVAAADGTVEKLYYSNGGGGITLYERSDDGRWMYYYAHLGGYAPGVEQGRRVRAGDPIAYVGDTGNAGPGNYHLHFGIATMAPGERWWQGTPIDPYPLLAAGRQGR
ncbi:M23 family metallopeptidase [Sphingomonas sp.]|uniref:M23 family metallopeptidase n=1 Tax=Sphingomonas sp. TaxID=28214 RepID=UPI001EB93FF4|nr:M23 family metallopeptidase [Sphingomonas sp.]MBX3594502.1 M23 family metallopeptidase [Sphingomonas sp.]